MDRCKHVGRLRLARDHSILNPQKWHCADCNTTESVWACLGCSHVACGRYIEEHALRHFLERRHPVALEVNELYVFCYLCDDYVLNDNATGDLKLLRGTLSAIKSQRYECTTRSGRTLRSAASASPVVGGEAPPGTARDLKDEDRMFTALWHRRHSLLGRAFRSWFRLTAGGRQRAEEERRREEEEERKREARERRLALKRQLREELDSAPPRKSHRLRRQSQRARAAAAAVASMMPRAARPSPATLTPTPKRRRSERRAVPPGARLAKTRTKTRATSTKAPTSTQPRTLVSKASKAAKVSKAARAAKVSKVVESPFRRRPTVTPGVTGLRNLGNTCYMNSILQVLSHLHSFRECFLQLDLNQALELLASAVSGGLARAARLPPSPPGCSRPAPPRAPRKGRLSGAGLSGGASRARSMELVQRKEPSSRHISLCHELHTLFQVMWSGKWALVSPFAMLHSVWQLIPAFRGYAQQDAQEFLCELLDKVQRELESTGTLAPASAPPAQRRLIRQVLSVVNTIFHGQLLSQVTCLACDNRSNTVEPFWDLSLEFPERYHCNSKETAAHFPCQLTEMLAKFTETEALEGSIYACEKCNSKRRRFSSKPVILTEAQKQLMVHKLPQVLRLHLKRFRWSGRNNREKIGVHVSFDQVLNMEPYCCRDASPVTLPRGERFLYELSAVVMHHGKGFGSGHYTAYCYNTEGGFWVHCNDSKLNVCTVEEVCKAQAYILFYTQRVSQDKGKPL
ncbi:ubiquitin carboxyl-terminal hydrolase 44-like [Megalops cyprinoides]|uniref:ubiquitin carboxyl-terminal hydrolase 44-like n=1 Tax=Megalops cyprinoides TaxID=118141 RepID=UPI0018648EBE|nr:ubiquitin carboxyl-terminal hydrolase 44-like [Megalops cyprinoides]XP_036373819.1 ubiquitin carboxyl-terminal hydrolase 44-like [Megalops cyprinoides]